MISSQGVPFIRVLILPNSEAILIPQGGTHPGDTETAGEEHRSRAGGAPEAGGGGEGVPPAHLPVVQGHSSLTLRHGERAGDSLYDIIERG